MVSWVEPGHFTTTSVNIRLWSHTTCTFIEWNPFLPTEVSPLAEGSLIWMWVLSMALMLAGNPPYCMNPSLVFTIACRAVGRGEMTGTPRSDLSKQGRQSVYSWYRRSRAQMFWMPHCFLTFYCISLSLCSLSGKLLDWSIPIPGLYSTRYHVLTRSPTIG